MDSEFNLATLKITGRGIERYSGLEVNDLLIGGMLNGVYRLPISRNRRRFIMFCSTEIIILALGFICSLPLGLAATRHLVNFSELPAMIRFLQVTFGSTLLIILGWHLRMWRATRSRTMLMQLLDEIDHYNHTLQAVEALDRLAAVHHSPVSVLDRTEVLQALEITRDSLISGLIMEKILRDNQKLITNRDQWLTHIKNNLATLKTLTIEHQANDYATLLNEALQIGLSVQQEVQKLSR